MAIKYVYAYLLVITTNINKINIIILKNNEILTHKNKYVV